MGPETKYSHMSQLLRPDEIGLFIFTKGNCFKIDESDGTGYTGWWKVDPRRRVDWIFIYYRPKKGCNKLYVARCGDLQDRARDIKYLIKLRDAKLVGYTDMNWVKFGGAAGNGIRYLPDLKK